MFFFDPIYFVFMVPALALALFAQWRVNHAFKKYSQYAPASGLTGGETSKELLRINGLSFVAVQPVEGNLTDYYDPRNKVLRLSTDVYNTRSLVALGVAAHETGHALQDKNKYFPMKIRSGLVPAANIGSQMAIPIFFVGLIVSGWLRSPVGGLIMELAIVLYSIAVLFTLITLPVEYNASHRAMAMLRDNNLITEEEYGPTKSVLSAAALTYVAAAASAILTLLYLILRSQGSRD